MEEKARLVVTLESEWDRFGRAGMRFPRSSAVECDRGRTNEVASKDRRGLAGGTSWDFRMANFDDSFEDFHRPATSPDPTHVFGRRTPRAPTTELGYPLVAAGRPPAAATHLLAATASSRASMTRPEAAAAGSEPPSVGERAQAAWTAIANMHRGLEPSGGQHGDHPVKTAQEIMWGLLQDPTFDGSYLLQLLLENVRSKFGPAATEATPSAYDQPTCKFCRNNNEEDIDHQFKDGSGLVVCPVLSRHVCDLCGVSGPLAHTRKYCPKNPLTLGCPEEGGFPPGVLPKDVYETTQMMLKMMNSR